MYLTCPIALGLMSKNCLITEVAFVSISKGRIQPFLISCKGKSTFSPPLCVSFSELLPFETLLTLLDHQMWRLLHWEQFSVTPTECLIIQLSSCTVCWLEASLTNPIIVMAQSYKTASSWLSEASCKSRLSPVLLTKLGYNSEVPKTPPWVWIIC